VTASAAPELVPGLGTGEKILLIRLAAIGDVVMASTLARRLRQSSLNVSISWLCGATVAPLVEQLKDVDEVIAIDDKRLLTGRAGARLQVVLPLWKRLRAGRFTRVYLLHADSRYRVLTAPLFGVPVIAQSRRDAHGAMNPVPGRFLGDEFARLADGREHRGPVAAHFPLGELRQQPQLASSAPNSRPRIALVPAGARNVLRESALKRWPVENYVALASSLAADGCEIVLVGSAHDEWARSEFTRVPTTDLIGRTTIPETLSTLASCDLVISHDTGPMHLARLAGAPVLALFGPTMPAQFVVADELTTVLWGGEHLACRPCYDGREFADCHDNQCISSIGVEIVLRTARALLQRQNSATHARRARQTPGETVLR
jgi:heptosyltransferase II